jgi:hypothetical protein
MGCGGCGKKTGTFKRKVKAKAEAKPAAKKLVVPIETPDHLLSPRQLRAKNRHLRAIARTARINARNEIADKLRLAANAAANSSSQTIVT